MTNDWIKYDAYRAAGQAIVALLHGAPVIQIGIDGVEIGWDDVPDAQRPRAEILADIAIGLGGVAAEDRFGFGCAPAETRTSLTFYDFNPSQLADLAEVNALVAVIDHDGSDDIYFQAFQQAIEFTAEGHVWEAIERLANILVERDVDACELDTIFCEPGRALEAGVPSLD